MMTQHNRSSFERAVRRVLNDIQIAQRREDERQHPEYEALRLAGTCRFCNEPRLPGCGVYCADHEIAVAGPSQGWDR